jgi:hypothetical protein
MTEVDEIALVVSDFFFDLTVSGSACSRLRNAAVVRFAPQLLDNVG